MSDLDTRPDEVACGPHLCAGPEELVITARRVYLGKTTEVARALPDREIRMIGAWCFLDHYGPEDITGQPGMQVWAHPHVGLCTVSWLFEGEVEHRDSVGSQVMVRPRELHVMTAGHGIVHSELSLPDHPSSLHGVQLWVALPDHARQTAPRFDSYRELPLIGSNDDHETGWQGQVLFGTVNGVTSPAVMHSPLTAADLQLEPAARATLQLDPEQEYGLYVVAGSVLLGSPTGDVGVGVDQLLYLGTGRSTIMINSVEQARMILVGGQPFGEELLMWWNFVGRSHQEVVAYRDEWMARTDHDQDRFPPVVSADERVMEAPPMPTTTLRPRPRRPYPGPPSPANRSS